MEPKVLVSVDLKWDEFGNVSHTLDAKVPANEYQKSDVVALSVVLLTGSQLGILPPSYALQVCDRILRHLDGLPLNPEPIQYPLSGARIELVQKDGTIVCLFHPSFLGGGTMEPEEAVSRLLGNLPLHLAQILTGELACFYRAGLLIVVNYYLTQGLPKGISRGIFSRGNFNQQKVQFAMLGFNETIYPHWKGGLNMPSSIFSERLEEARSQYKKMMAEF